MDRCVVFVMLWVPVSVCLCHSLDIKCEQQQRQGQQRRQTVHVGGVGSSETWNSELDRIRHLHDMFGTLCEEMEAAGAWVHAEWVGAC